MMKFSVGKKTWEFFCQKFFCPKFSDWIQFSPKNQRKIQAMFMTVISAETLYGKFSRKFFGGNFVIIFFCWNFKSLIENSPLFLISFSVFGFFLRFISYLIIGYLFEFIFCLFSENIKKKLFYCWVWDFSKLYFWRQRQERESSET